MTDRKLTEAEMISYLELSVAIGGTARLAPEEAKILLDLINRQKAKLEALQMDNAQLQSDIVNANMNADHALAEIERLKNPIPVLCVDELTDELIEELKKQPFLVSPASNENVVFLDESKIKSEAVKEFAERLKAKEAVHFCKCGQPFVYTDLFNGEIDNLVKQMTEERTE